MLIRKFVYIRKRLQIEILLVLIVLMYLVYYKVVFHGLMKQVNEDYIPKNPRSNVEKIDWKQHLRRQQITNNCHKRRPDEILPAGSETYGISPNVFSNLIVNDKYKVIYCQIPKVASTNWKRLFLMLDGHGSNPRNIKSADVHNKSLGHLRYLNEYSPTEIITRLKTYNKFLFVRHPFDRLVSAYRNKFIESYNLTYFNCVYGRYIKKKFRNSDSQSEDLKINFQEFIRYILEENDDVMDNHWRQYDILCRPCLTYYHFIGHFEDLDHDSQDVLTTFDINTVTFPTNISSEYTVPTSVLRKTYFQSLPRIYLSKLYEKYKNDFEMFGYTMK